MQEATTNSSETILNNVLVNVDLVIDKILIVVWSLKFT
ncbi:hypothetical protein I600_3276 [Maribacter dokdonensis DSW-8]|nr:hypothetical protein I600_3276 [Maribacter dokdonensis DSW-8]